MPKAAELIGSVFGKLTVLSRDGGRKNAYWNCVCSCGNKARTTTTKLKNGHTTSCGCNRIISITSLNTTHGMAKTRTYKTWKEMRSRCSDKNKDNYKYYGGRGIEVCKKWDSFENFLIDMGEIPMGKTIDRIDSDGNYEKDNCRWATPKEQASTNRGIYVKNTLGLAGMRSYDKKSGTTR